LNRQTGAASLLEYDANLNSAGQLTPKSQPSVPAGVQPSTIAVSPGGLSVYVVNDRDNTLSQYDVGPGGQLAPKNPATLSLPYEPGGVVVSPDGSSVYVADGVDNAILQYDVGPGGRLTPKSPASVSEGLSTTPPVGWQAENLAISPNGRSLYAANVANQVPGLISQFDVGPGGQLSLKTPATVDTGWDPIGIAVSPDGSSLYTGNSVQQFSNNGTISQYDIGAGGRLAPKNPASFVVNGSPTSVVVSPDNTSVYAANTTAGGGVFQFDVGLGGRLTPKSQAIVASRGRTGALAVSPLRSKCAQDPSGAEERGLLSSTVAGLGQGLGSNTGEPLGGAVHSLNCGVVVPLGY
jgi:DNA-binding beta-propeller fold protein YncE